jgi:putative inorganic carbon (HCO3(-)) transporter
VAELIAHLKADARGTRRGGDLLWFALVAGGGSLLTALVMTYSLQAGFGLVLVAFVIALHQYDRRAGIAALLALWLLAPMFRRLFDLLTGYVNADPLALAPVLATAGVAGLELLRGDLPPRVRRILLLAGVGFTIGLPLGMLHPLSGLYTFAAYLAGLSAAVIGFHDVPTSRSSAMRRVLIVGLIPIAVYGISQRVVGLPVWDQSWLNSVDFSSIGTGDGVHVRVFASLNAPGTLAPLLGVGLLCYLTVRRSRSGAGLGALALAVALALTYVRAAWMALALAALAHVIVSRGRSARPILTVLLLTALATVALSPISVAARSVLDRATTVSSLGSDVSYSDRITTLAQTAPKAIVAPLGHGLGSAGEQSRLDNPQALQTPDDGFLALLYQVGPIGFLLVMAAVAAITAAAWRSARAQAPGQDYRPVVFAVIVFFLVLLTAGDEFYGVTGIVFWYFGGQALALQYGRDRVELGPPEASGTAIRAYRTLPAAPRTSHVGQP